jgi:DNA-binding transcriptional ArsR family regulator
MSSPLPDTRRECLRAVGPVAWVLLEELSFRAPETTDDLCVVASNIAELSEAIGVGRDATARALTRLRDVGLLRVETVRDDGGHFASNRYVFERIGQVVVRTSANAGVSARASTVRREPVAGETRNGTARPRATDATTRAAITRDNQLSLLNE